MKIVITGTPVRSGNRGVSALAASLVNLCVRADPNAAVTLLIGCDRDDPVAIRVDGSNRMVPVIPVRLSPHARVRDHLAWVLTAALVYRLFRWRRARAFLVRSTPALRCLVEADLVGDIRGGDSFSDLYGITGFACASGISAAAILARGSIVQFPQTFGPFNSVVARWIARAILRRSAVVLARDEPSRERVQAIVGGSAPVRFCPDVAFTLEAVRPVALTFSSISRPVGFNVNGLLYHGAAAGAKSFGLALNYRAYTKSVLQALLAETEGEVWLIPHTWAPPGHPESDPDACIQLRALLPPAAAKRVRLITAEWDQHEIKGIIGGCEFMVASRLHACIAALSQGIPCVGVAYSDKFSGVFATVGMSSWVIDGRRFDAEGAVARTIALYRIRAPIREPLLRRSRAAAAAVELAFDELLAPSAMRAETTSYGHVAMHDRIPSALAGHDRP